MKVAVFPSVPVPDQRDSLAGGVADPGAFLRFWARSMGVGAETALPALGLRDGAGPGKDPDAAADVAWQPVDMPDDGVVLQPLPLPDGAGADRGERTAAWGDAGLAAMLTPADAVAPDPAVSFAAGDVRVGPPAAPEPVGTVQADRIVSGAAMPREILRPGADLPGASVRPDGAGAVQPRPVGPVDAGSALVHAATDVAQADPPAPSVRLSPVAPTMPKGAEPAAPGPSPENPPAPGRGSVAETPGPVSSQPPAGSQSGRQPDGAIALVSWPDVAGGPAADRRGHPAAAALPSVQPTISAPATSIAPTLSVGGATSAPDNPVASGPGANMVRPVVAVRDAPMPVGPRTAPERAALPLAPGFAAAPHGDPAPVREVAIRVALAHSPGAQATDRPAIPDADVFGTPRLPVPPQVWPLVLARVAGGFPGLGPSGPAVAPAALPVPAEDGSVPLAQPTGASSPLAPVTPAPTAAVTPSALPVPAKEGGVPVAQPIVASPPLAPVTLAPTAAVTLAALPVPAKDGGVPVAQPTVAPPPQAPATPAPTAAVRVAAPGDGLLPFAATASGADPARGLVAPEPPLPAAPGAPLPSGLPATAGPALPEPQARPEPPPPARQIADALRLTGGSRVELVLMPEELGRVTIGFQGEGDTLRVHLAADRPETLDLLRRHAPDLAADLRAMGYDTAGFSFGSSGHPHPGQARPEDPAPDNTAGQPTIPAPGALPRPAAAGSSGSLDLRL